MALVRKKSHNITRQYVCTKCYPHFDIFLNAFCNILIFAELAASAKSCKTLGYPWPLNHNTNAQPQTMAIDGDTPTNIYSIGVLLLASI
jgi:hypothetical protein